MKRVFRNSAGRAQSVYRAQFLPNFLGFQLFWFLAVLGRDDVLLVLVLLLALHFLLVTDALGETLFIGLVAVPGVIMDGVWFSVGLFEFASSLWGLPVPLWLCLIWVAFAATLRHSMKWLMLRPALAIPLAGICAPLSYLAGERLNAVAFGYGFPVTYVVLAVGWCCVMVWFCFVVLRFERNGD